MGKTTVDSGASASSAGPLRVVFVTTTLDCGGSELTLVRLANGFDRARIAMTVVSLRGAGAVAKSLAAANTPLHTLDWTSLVRTPRALMALGKLLRNLRPDIVQGWMLHGNLAASLAGILARIQAPVLWYIGHSLEDPRNEKASTRLLARHTAVLARRTERVVLNSHRAARDHARIGFDKARAVVIPNGIDGERFCPQSGAREELRAMLRVTPETPVIGLVARVHPTKDHMTFLKAARLLVAAGSSAHFVLVGRGTDGPRLAELFGSLGLRPRVHALGERYDVPRIMAGLDICSLSSLSEGCPSVIGEAMASGVLCVATDAGDTARLIGDTGRVVPRSNPALLCAAWLDVLAMDHESRRQRGAAARQRILEHFSLRQGVLSYQNLYWETVSRRGRFADCGGPVG